MCQLSPIAASDVTDWPLLRHHDGRRPPTRQRVNDGNARAKLLDAEHDTSLAEAVYVVLWSWFCRTPSSLSNGFMCSNVRGGGQVGQWSMEQRKLKQNYAVQDGACTCSRTVWNLAIHSFLFSFALTWLPSAAIVDPITRIVIRGKAVGKRCCSVNS